MVIHIRDMDPQPRQIQTLAEVLQLGGVIIYPTDTIYGLGCDILQLKAIERICEIKKMEPSKAQLSFVCNDLSDLSAYKSSLPNHIYKLLKEYMTSQYTLRLTANKKVSKSLKSKKNTVGLR